MLILFDLDCPALPAGRLLQFKRERDDFEPPQRISTREMMRMEVEAWRQHKQGNGCNDLAEAKASEGPQNDDLGAMPVDSVIETVPSGSPEGQQSSAIIVLRDSETFHADRADRSLMRRLTPPLMTDDERGQGNSTNARLHRLLREY